MSLIVNAVKGLKTDIINADVGLFNCKVQSLKPQNLNISSNFNSLSKNANENFNGGLKETLVISETKDMIEGIANGDY